MAEPLDSPGQTRDAETTHPLLAGRYRLTRLLATGGMARVWEASDEVLARAVAVKLLHPHLAADPSFVERFRHEAIAAARLSHPSIVAIYDTISEEGREAIVMELVPGTTLRQHLDQRRSLETTEVVSVGAQVADALEVAHRAYLVHRDIKPANILLHPDGRVLVADFGIAKALHEGDRTDAGAMVGTAKYLAPEQVQGAAVDGRTDIYSLGVVLYEALCGRPPFLADNDTAMALARLHAPPLRPRQVRASIPRPLDEVVMRALEREPAQRFASAAELRASLLAALHGRLPDPVLLPSPKGDAERAAVAPVSPPAASGPVPQRRRRDRGWLVTLVAVVLIGVALGIAGVLLGHTDAGRTLLGRDHPRPSAAPVALAPGDVHAFDPDGDGQENDAAAANVVAAPSAGWETEHYRDAAFGGLKPGVGLYVDLGRTTTVQALRVASPSAGWSAQVYVRTTPPAPGDPLAAWGDPAAKATNLDAGTHDFDLHGAHADAVLVWITRLAHSGSCSSGSYCWSVQISKLTVTS